MEGDFNKRYQTLLVLWFGLFMSVVMYFVFSLVAPFTNDQSNPANPTLVITLMVLGFLLVLLSFVVKGKLLELSIQKQDPGLVQKALVVACALCEVSAVLGLLERFLIGYRYYYFLFLFSAAGIALHFPRRSQLQNAGFRDRQQLN
jgi:hypothetical protein